VLQKHGEPGGQPTQAYLALLGQTDVIPIPSAVANKNTAMQATMTVRSN
jgi:hypothetical protein